MESIPIPICSLIFPGGFGLAWSRERSPQRWRWAPGGALTLAPSWQWRARSGSGGTWEGLAALRLQPPTWSQYWLEAPLLLTSPQGLLASGLLL